MTTLAAPPQPSFQWTPQPRAQAIVLGLLERFLRQHAFAAGFADRLRDEAGVRFADTVDFIQIDPATFHDGLEADARDAGFVGSAEALTHPGGVLPTLRLMAGPFTVGIRVERVTDFGATHQLAGEPNGTPGSRLRWWSVQDPSHDVELWAVERHGSAGFALTDDSPADVLNAERWLERFRTRPRRGDDDATLFADTAGLIERAKSELPMDWVCDLFFQAERDYWMRRNDAARVQYARQAALGIGWANHDHHTYRSSRENIHRLVGCLEALGLVCRESFTPGREAGWGAQVMEQPVTRIVVFADVDMSPEELKSDFSHVGLESREQLGTVGLWTALHGDSFLAAGMHHLECMFDFDGLREQLAASAGVKMMPAFSNFAHLKQQFTQGQVWPVDPVRVATLGERGQITAEQAEKFLKHGALGSHLENLERNDAFKGFNQAGITHIINDTDPRAH